VFETEFKAWLVEQKVLWEHYKAQEGYLLSFAEYLTARRMFMEENYNA
jgi:hypothetical protein